MDVGAVEVVAGFESHFAEKVVGGDGDVVVADLDEFEFEGGQVPAGDLDHELVTDSVFDDRTLLEGNGKGGVGEMAVLETERYLGGPVLDAESRRRSECNLSGPDRGREVADGAGSPYCISDGGRRGRRRPWLLSIMIIDKFRARHN